MHPNAELGKPVEAAYAEHEARSLEQLIADTRDLYAETTDQFKGIADLAFMELNLAISSFHIWVWTLALFSVASIMTCTFVVAATLIGLTATALSPVAVMLVMGGLSAIATCLLFLYLKVLSRKMTFRTLRHHLTRPTG